MASDLLSLCNILQHLRAIHFYHGYKARVRLQAVTYLARYNNSSNPINSVHVMQAEIVQEVETFTIHRKFVKVLKIETQSYICIKGHDEPKPNEIFYGSLEGHVIYREA